MSRTLTLFLVAMPAAVLANGGPAKVGSEPGLLGLPVPYAESRISLASEELTIRLPKDAAGEGMQFEVEARYTLVNKGKPLELLYAVPGNVGPRLEVVSSKQEGRLTLAKPAPPGRVGLVSTLQKGPMGPVTIVVGGRTFSCAGRKLVKDGEYTEGQTWCSTKLTIPTGDAVPMVLTYRDRLFAEGEESQSCPFAETEKLGLIYDFHPAGFWAGPVSRLQMRVELGNLDGLEKIQGPPGHRKEGAALIWDLKDVDLKTLPMLELSFDGKGRQLRTFAAKSPRRVSPASPARCLAPNKHGRLELTAQLGPPVRGNQGDPLVEDQLCGLVVALDSATSSRPRKVWVGSCGDKPTPGIEVELPVASVYLLHANWGDGYPSCGTVCEFFSGTSIKRDALAPRGKKTACVQLEFLDAEGEPPCVTGLAPLLLSDQ